MTKVKFRIASKLAESFKIGDFEKRENFFMTGRIEKGEPIISCRLFGPDGLFLCEIEENELLPSSAKIYHKVKTQNGWIVSDSYNIDILKVETVTTESGHKVVNLIGDFYNKQKKLVAEGTSIGVGVAKNCPVELL